MNYSDVQAFVSAGLTAKGYTTLPLFDPGPATNPTLLQQSPGQIVFLTVGNGPGLDTEEIFDRVFILVHAVGAQYDYAGAEKLADDLDRILLAADHNTTIGTAKALYINRVGGRPDLNDYDVANRYHFQCSYIAEVQSGL